jgi:DNA-binding winged helix-turn-helix (wHTH) protein
VSREKDSRWKFGDAMFDERTLQLSVGGKAVELERKPAEVLRCLLARAGEVVTHADILNAAWPDRVTGESVLKKCISRIREALRDDDHAVVETVHGQGYRLAIPVETENPTRIVMHTRSEIRVAAVLIVDIANTVGLRTQLGDKVAGRRITQLLETVVETARAHGGELIKSYGDDVMAIFEDNPVPAAARVAILAQKHAAEAGLQLYAGLHYGEVEFRQTMGHPDALGLTVNIAARLHKLTEGVPGRIFLAEELAMALPANLQLRAGRFGTRELKGLGTINVWTLDWQDNLVSAVDTTTMQAQPSAIRPQTLALRHAAQDLRVTARERNCVVGRGKTANLRVPDPEARISSTHLLFEFSAGRWFVQDVSRNGTWMRDGKSNEETLLPYCKQIMLPAAGGLSLGRPFAEDPDGRFDVSFTVKPD